MSTAASTNGPAIPRSEPVESTAPHLLGEHRGGSGPLVVVTAGIHGNEPSGVHAFGRVLARLHRGDLPFRGRLAGIAGNLAALPRHERFVNEDLNRIWSPARIAEIRQPGWAAPSVDAQQQAEMLAILERIFSEITGAAFFLDLHTSSAQGEPFVCIGDTLRNRAFATSFPVPVILGLEEQVDGALLEYVNNLGHVTVGVEAGQHDHPASIDHHEAFIWLALGAAGCLAPGQVPNASDLRARLRAAVGRLPSVMEVRYRHAITGRDGFTMQPGYVNFQPIRAGDLLARDAAGEIRALERGRVLLPLYQGLGSDGFFVVREVRPFWLSLSAALRRLRLDRLAHWLPGVRRGAHADDLVADRHVARWFTVEVFHLLGFRKQRAQREQIVFSRRREAY